MLVNRYSDKVEVEYVDIDDEAVDQHKLVVPYIDNPKIPLPIVTINDQFVFWGPIYFPTVFHEIGKLITSIF